MSEHWGYWATIAAVVLAAIVLAWLATPNACEGAGAEELSPRELGALLDEGWRGKPGDGKERLYPGYCF